MKKKGETKRKRIIIYYVIAIVFPSIILGFLAFRGVKNDQALVEREQRRTFLESGQNINDDVDGYLKVIESKFIGIGWFGQTTKLNGWGVDKRNQINETNCDFVLALENTCYPNYISEKILDGFMLDRVTLYLGDPNIEKHIPLECFIDLRPYYNFKTKVFNFDGLGKKLNEMTQLEYDEIILNATKFRATIAGKHQHYDELLTHKILDFIKEC